MTPSADRLIRRLRQRIDAGQYDAALLSARKWAALDPAEAMPCYWEGYCLERLGQAQAAEDSLRQGLQRQADHPECLSLLARCLAAQGRQKDAWETARQAENMNSENPEVWETVGIVYGWVNEFAAAARAFEKVREMQPENSGNLISLAGMLNYCHRVDEAEEVYHQVLALEPTRFLSYWSLAQLRKQTANRNHVDLLKRQLSQYGSQADAQLYLNLALAKELEDLDRYEESFSHLSAGMNERRRRIAYHSDQDRELFDTMKRTFDPAFCQAPGPHDPNDEAIFIVSMPRTGSTLLEQLIAAHPDVFAAGELQNMLAAWVQQIGKDPATLTPVDVAAAGRRLDFARLGRDYIESTRPRSGKTPRFIDKLPTNFLYLGAILKALPNARVVHMTRNPMDTCYANYKQLFARNAHPWSYDQEELAAYFRRYRDLMDHWHECFPGAICDVSYEALVQDTETEMRRVFEFLGLQWVSEYLDYRKKEQAVGTASTAQVRQAVYQTSLQKWRHYERQLQPLRRALGPALGEN
jgi:Flp pilus assembly protein TadD